MWDKWIFLVLVILEASGQKADTNKRQTGHKAVIQNVDI